MLIQLLKLETSFISEPVQGKPPPLRSPICFFLMMNDGEMRRSSSQNQSNSLVSSSSSRTVSHTFHFSQVDDPHCTSTTITASLPNKTSPCLESLVLPTRLVSPPTRRRRRQQHPNSAEAIALPMLTIRMVLLPTQFPFAETKKETTL